MGDLKKTDYLSPFCKSQTEVGTKHPCLAQQQATILVTSKLHLLLDWAALTARWFRQDDLFSRKQRKPEWKNLYCTHYRPFLHNIQVFFISDIFSNISLSICEYDVEILSSHLNVICMEISINCDSLTSDPIWEVSPTRRKIYSSLGT